jgi:prepilin-type N-terminal cleavage/methylation domain-containing protein
MKKIKDQKGFSLVEMLLVILLLFIIVALVSSLFFTSEKANRDIINIVRSEIDARTALYRISKDIRETHEIKFANYDEVVFLSNIDEDEYYEEINYYLVAEDSHYNLYRQVDSTDSKLYIKNIVDSSIFLYFTDLGEPADGMPTPVDEEAELQNIKFVDINLNVDQSGNQSNKTMTLNTMITLRNRIYQ